MTSTSIFIQRSAGVDHEALWFSTLSQHLEGARGCSPSRLPLDFEFVDLTKARSHTPDYLALNPTGRTPTLVDGDLKLWEFDGIMQYLAGQKPNSLWPNDARTRADIMRWQSWHLAHFSKEGCEPLLFERLVKQILNLGPPDEAVVAKGSRPSTRRRRCSTRMLANSPILSGKDVTLADFSVAAPLFYAERADLPIAPYATFGIGSAVSHRCPAGARRRRNPPQPQPDRMKHVRPRPRSTASFGRDGGGLPMVRMLPREALGRSTASAPAYRRGSRRSRAGSCGRASRPRHISPAAGMAGIWNRPAPRAAPASPTGRYRGR